MAFKKLMAANTLIRGFRLDAGRAQRKSKPNIRGKKNSVFECFIIWVYRVLAFKGQRRNSMPIVSQKMDIDSKKIFICYAFVVGVYMILL